jgi:hypothetical protein
MALDHVPLYAKTARSKNYLLATLNTKYTKTPSNLPGLYIFQK